MNKKKKITKKVETLSRRKTKKAIKRRPKLTMTTIIISLILGVFSILAFRRKQHWLGAMFAVLAVFNITLPFLLPLQVEFYIQTSALMVFVTGVISQVIFAAVNLVCSKTANQLH